jgi:hypothetical protein
VQVVFRGNSNGGPNNPLLPVTLAGNATTLLGVVGAGGPTSGPSQGTLWALTKQVTATYTLMYVHDVGTSGGTLQEPSSSNCLLSCCGVNRNGGPGSGQLYSTDVGCACAFANPNLDCFAGTCPDIAAAAQRCLDLGIMTRGALACGGPTGPGCTAPSYTCCYAGGTGLVCTGPSGTGPSGTPCAYVARCTNDSHCSNGVCCAFDDEALCSTACPPERRVCTPDSGPSACAGGASCAKAANCSIGVCGATPSLCQ